MHTANYSLHRTPLPSTFWKFALTERTSFAPVFVNWKKIKIFTLMKRGKGGKQRFVLQRATRDGSMSGQWEWHRQAPSLELHSGISASRAITLNCEHLCFIPFYASVSKMGHKVISSLYAILAYKRFQKHTLLLDSRGNLYNYKWWKPKYPYNALLHYAAVKMDTSYGIIKFICYLYNSMYCTWGFWLKTGKGK